MARWYNAHGWDVFAWNYRGCAEGPNKKMRFYHSGATEDLEDVIIHVLKRHFTTLSLVGFSLGGNLVLKYLGENNHLPDAVRSAVVFSVPLDLHAGASNLHRAQNRMYELRFLRSLKRKVLLKHRVIPQLDIQPLGKVSTLVDFDDVYTAPMHGFDSAPDYYRKCSALYFLDGITTPTMLVNAQNDPFLTPECTPHDTLEKHQYIHLLAPRHGGHAGFTSFNRQNTYWSEMQALGFSEKHA
jgi:predicted alpha/beta-fold hydrolase